MSGDGSVVDKWIQGVFNHTSMQIFVNTVTGKTIALDVESNYTMEDVKVLIKHKIGIDPREQLWGYQGRMLKQHRTLMELGISNGATLGLMLQLRGGGGGGGGKGKGNPYNGPMLGFTTDPATGNTRWQGPVSVLIRALIVADVPFSQRITVYNVFGANVLQNDPDMYPTFREGLNAIIDLGETANGTPEMRVLEDRLIALMHGLERGSFRGTQG